MPIKSGMTMKIAIAHVGISDILQCKYGSKLEELPTNITEPEKTWQKYQISKIFVSLILPSSRTKMNIKSLNEKLKNLCFGNNFNFIKHQEITSNDLWVDGIYLKNLGKPG